MKAVKNASISLFFFSDTSIVAGLMPVIQFGTGGIRHRPQFSAPPAPMIIESNGVQKYVQLF